MTDECFTALKPVFQSYVDELKATDPVTTNRLLPEAKGLYALSENETYRYVGITRNLRRRWQMHRTGGVSSATFAVKLARVKASRERTYSSIGGLKALMNDADFRKAFEDSKVQIRGMNLQFIKWEGDDGDLVVLEIYAARALKTTYNDFATR